MSWHDSVISLAKNATQNATKRERIAREMQGIVAEAMGWFRRQTPYVKTAEGKAAAFLGITPRRVRSYRQDEVDHVSAEEAERLREARVALIAKMRADLAHDMERLDRLEIECRNHLGLSHARSWHSGSRVGGNR